MPSIPASPKTENTRAKALLFPTVLLPWHEKAFHKNILSEYSASLSVSQLPKSILAGKETSCQKEEKTFTKGKTEDGKGE